MHSRHQAGLPVICLHETSSAETAHLIDADVVPCDGCAQAGLSQDVTAVEPLGDQSGLHVVGSCSVQLRIPAGHDLLL